MNKREKERSYERYVQWQENKVRYEHESVAYVLLFGTFFGVPFLMICAFILKNFHEIMFGIKVLLISVIGLSLLYVLYRKYKMEKARRDLIERPKKSGAKNIQVNPKTKQISLTLPEEDKEKILSELADVMQKKGFDLSCFQNNKTEEQVKEEKKPTMIHTTETGYVNRNNQRNNGRTNEKGTDCNQWFYNMECLDCGAKYKANGSDVFHRKCPKCQGGRP